MPYIALTRTNVDDPAYFGLAWSFRECSGTTSMPSGQLLIAGGWFCPSQSLASLNRSYPAS
jgi:hypothetical protein